VATYVALVRAINLGKQRRVPMARLRAAFTDAGYEGVTTHLQSGNVVLASRARTSGSVAKAVEKVLRAEFALEVDVMVRSAGELDKVMKTNPFLRPGVSAATLHVAFLKYPNGVAGSKISPPLFERALGTPATVRTWRVVTRLRELAEAAASGR
jgi:uncharacterized protein (DUF1697 family)